VEFEGVAAQADRVRRGEASARKLVELALVRIERLNGELNAFAAVFADGALADANRADERRSRGDRGPLLGVPVAVKDEIEIAGEVTSRGTGAISARVARQRHDAVTRHGLALHCRPRDAAHRGRRLDAELAPKQTSARLRLHERPGAVAASREAADEQLVVALVERSMATRRAASSAARSAFPAASSSSAASCSMAAVCPANRPRATTSHDSKAGLAANSIPSSSSPPAAAASRTSTATSGARISSTGPPSIVAPPLSARRSCARFQRSAPSGSSASEKSSSARRLRVAGPSDSSG
jgi:hypothetical protein